MTIAKVVVNDIAGAKPCSETEKPRIPAKTRIDAIAAAFLARHKRNSVNGTRRNADESGKRQAHVVQDVQDARRTDGAHAAAFDHKSEFALLRFLHGSNADAPKVTEHNALDGRKQSAVCLVRSGNTSRSGHLGSLLILTKPRQNRRLLYRANSRISAFSDNHASVAHNARFLCGFYSVLPLPSHALISTRTGLVRPRSAAISTQVFD